MEEIYITDIYQEHLPVRSPRQPRQRFFDFFIDMYALHGESLAEETLLSGGQYSYAELGDLVLQQCSELQNLDLMVIATWSYEFDPEHGTCGAYFSDQYKIKNRIFDVCDQGTLCSLTGIDLIQKYLRSSESNNAILLALEQSTTPKSREDENSAIPILNAAVAVCISKNKEKAKWRIIAVERILASESDFSLIAWIEKIKLPKENLSFVVKKQGKIDEISKKEAMHHPEYFCSLDIKKLNIPSSCLQSFLYLSRLSPSAVNQPCLVLFEEDVETMEIACLILERVQ